MATVGGTGGRLHLRLFLEGIEVPAISAVVQSNINAPATASIQVVPSDKVLELKPRTLVHLFFYDYTLDLPTSPEKPVPVGAGDDLEAFIAEQFGGSSAVGSKVASSPLAATPDPLKGYKLLFGGEIVGVAAMKTPTARQMVLQCADWSTYWDTTYQMFISFAPHGNFLTESSAVWAGGNSLFDDILDGHSAVMNRFLHEQPLTPGLKNVKGLMGGIIRLLEAMGGVPNHTHGVNDFFTIAELMRHLLQQITAEQDDNTAQQLFDNKEFWQWLERGTLSLGELVSFRDLLKLLFQWIFYEVVPVVCPMYVPSIASLKTKKKVSVGGTPKEIQKLLQDFQAEAKKNAQKAAERGPRFDPNANDRTLAINMAGEAEGGGLSSLLTRDDVPTKMKSSIEVAISYLHNIRDGSVTTDLSKAVNDSLNVDYAASWNLVAKQLNQALSYLSKSTVKLKEAVKPGELDRLQTQIFRPDCFFAAPPKCNVFFPDVYTQFSYQRSFLQEPTRLRLQTSWMFGGNDALLADYFYAPSMSQIRDIAKKQGNSGVRALLPWEKFTGILPKFEHIAEINYIANKRQKDLNKNVRGKSVSFSARTANFNYFKYRFAARTMEVSMRFNPFVAVGFPALLIEKPFIVDPDRIREALDKSSIGEVNLNTDDFVSSIQILAQKLRAPTQYLGMVAAMSHSVDQGGGTTSVTMTHARTHRITEDDFLQTFAAEVLKQTNTQDRTTVLDVADLLQKGDYKLLKLLIAATPQNIPQQMQQAEQEKQQAQDEKNQGVERVTLGDRPNPDLNPAGLRAIATGLFSGVTLPEFGGSPTTVVADSGAGTPLRGKVHQTTLSGTRTTILEPNPYPETLRPGSKGPNGGQVTQIQLFGDEIVRLTRAEINKTAKSKDKKDTKAKANDSEVVYLWKRAVIHEDVTSKTTSVPLPIEEVIRPPWFSPLYSNLFIGDHIYQAFFGTGSIVDEMIFQTPLGAGGQGVNKQKKSDLLSDIQAADGDLKKIGQILNDAKASSLSDIPSVETAVDTLAYIYGETRRLNLDVHRFIADYTSRPIATMEDIFGSADLEYKKNGDKLERVKGTPGFHSTSVGPYDNLMGLLDNPDQALPRLLTKGKAAPLSRTLDPRPDRRAQVLAYTSDLGAGQGSLGIGLLG